MTNRIRWEAGSSRHGGHEGYVGTLDQWVFAVWQSPYENGSHKPGEWVLTPAITPVGPHPEGAARGPDELKAEAERWLERFVTSLGASFGSERTHDA